MLIWGQTLGQAWQRSREGKSVMMSRHQWGEVVMAKSWLAGGF